MRKIIGIGETILDIIFKDDQPVKAVPGGSTFNALISIGRTDTPCEMVTEIGDDHVGEIIVDFLKENGVDTQYVYRHHGTQSHVSLAFLNERNDAEYAFYKHHGALAMPQEMPEVWEGDIILFGSFYAINPVIRDYTRRFLTMAKEKGAVLYYDINFRASHIKDIPETIDSILENFRLSSVVRGSAEDFSILFGKDCAREVYEEHIAPYCPVFIYTDSDKPVQLHTPWHRADYPAKPIKTVSTIGAGDNFNAGFCYGLYRLCEREQWATPDLSSLTAEQWNEIIASGQRFSSEVCQSLDNYIRR